MYRWLSIFSFILISACSGRVINFVNEDAPLKTYDTYVLVGLKGKNVGEAPDQAAVFRRIEGYIINEMARRQYTKTDNDPDLILRYEIVSGTRTERNNNNMSFYYVPPPNNRQVVESVILLELTDRKTKKLVWHASLDLREHSRLTKRKDPLQAAFQTMFNTYPYRAGSDEPDPNLIVK